MTELVTALAGAMEHATGRLGRKTLPVTSLSVALVAEHLIAAGWPAGLDGPAGNPRRSQDEPDGAP